MPVPSEVAVVSPRLVGRASQIDLLLMLTRQVCEQRGGSAALISGEAGVGKSRLVAEARSMAEQHGMHFMQGNCFETDRTLPYAPVLDLLRSLLAAQSNLRVEEFAACWSLQAPELVKILPELRARLSGLLPSPPLEPAQEKRRLYDALAQFFVRLAAAGPLLIAFEDLHWADDTSLEWLLYLAHRSRGYPILLLMTYRSDEAHPSLRHFLAEADRQRLAVEITLDALSFEEVDTMLRAIFNLERPVRPEFLKTIYALTGGNPFFIEEVLKSLIVSGGIYYTGVTWDRKPVRDLRIPRSVQDALQRRTASLSGAAQEVLAVASVIGQRFDYTLLRGLSGLRESEFLALVKELVSAELVVELSAEQFAFRHALTRQASYSHLLARELRALHRTIAEKLEELHSGSPEPYVPDLAYHYSEAEEWPKAWKYSEEAGIRARALYSPGAAVEHLTRAIEAARHVALDLPAGLYRERGYAYALLGEFEQSLADFETALQISRHSHDPEGEWQSLLDLGLLWAERDYSRTGSYYERALTLARHDLGASEEADSSRILAHSLNRVANWYMNVEQPVEAVRYHQEALAIFERLNDLAGKASSLDFLAMTSVLSADLIGGLDYYRQAVAIFRTLDDRQSLSSSLAVLCPLSGGYHVELAVPVGNLPELAEETESAARIAEEIGWHAGAAFALCCLGAGLGSHGHYARALVALEQALDIATSIEHRQWITYANWVLGALHLDLLSLERAYRHSRAALDTARDIGSLHWIYCAAGSLASVCIAQGDLTQAETILDVLGEDTPYRTVGQRLAWYAWAELAMARGDAAEALRVIDLLVASTPHIERHGVASIPRLAAKRAEALIKLRRWPEAESELREALASARAQGRRPQLWRIYLALCNLHQAQGRRAQAEEAAVLARSAIEELAESLEAGAPRADFARRAGALLPEGSKHNTPAPSSGGLTRREREVATLIATGKTNIQVGDALYVTERTVEGHVSNILSKLGFTSRSQIAAWAVTHLASPGR
jgi:DNA-binding CsgD family transcriptional regulator/tetratricopeptide (TPR) repeat protein